MRKFLTLCSVAGISSLIAAGSALAAAYPTSVLGTWTIRANDTQPFTFTVQTQSSDAPCAVITGVLGAPNDTIAGYYCPATGLVSFERNSSNPTVLGGTFQIFSGQASWAGSGNITTQITGNFTNYGGGDNTGAFSFSAYLPVP